LQILKKSVTNIRKVLRIGFKIVAIAFMLKDELRKEDNPNGWNSAHRHKKIC